jgi:FdhD protein
MQSPQSAVKYKLIMAPTQKNRIWTYEEGRLRERRDHLAVEEPLEIRLEAGGQRQSLTVTMRTPGNDFELAAGLLYSEGIAAQRDSISTLRYCVDSEVDGEQRYNILHVALRSNTLPHLEPYTRRFVATAACGLCGKATLESLRQEGWATLPSGPRISPTLIAQLPERLRAEQAMFEHTGGLHAAALFDEKGQLLAVREDIGRHNAVDKLVGWALLGDRLPLVGHILLVSGRVGYEIAQKALAAGIPIICAISAPSSLAVSLCREFGVTLVGFVRDGRFNVYTGIERLAPQPV